MKIVNNMAAARNLLIHLYFHQFVSWPLTFVWPGFLAVTKGASPSYKRTFVPSDIKWTERVESDFNYPWNTVSESDNSFYISEEKLKCCLFVSCWAQLQMAWAEQGATWRRFKRVREAVSWKPLLASSRPSVRLLSFACWRHDAHLRDLRDISQIIFLRLFVNMFWLC